MLLSLAPLLLGKSYILDIRKLHASAASRSIRATAVAVLLYIRVVARASQRPSSRVSCPTASLIAATTITALQTAMPSPGRCLTSISPVEQPKTETWPPTTENPEAIPARHSRGGPKSTEKVTVCYPQPKTTQHQTIMMSVDHRLNLENNRPIGSFTGVQVPANIALESETL